MRGKDDLNLFQKVVKGITPAYAGKSAVRFRSDFAEQDHPRLCGEKGCPRPDTCDIGRITPAYAGKSLPAHSRPRQIQDHPRLCGEKMVVAALSCCKAGSPPPMRGKAFRNAMYSASHRITPAYAGKRRGKNNGNSCI